MKILSKEIQTRMQNKSAVAFLETYIIFHLSSTMIQEQKSLKVIPGKPSKKLVTASYQKRPSHVGKYVPLKSVCSRMPSTPPSACIMSVL